MSFAILQIRKTTPRRYFRLRSLLETRMLIIMPFAANKKRDLP